MWMEVSCTSRIAFVYLGSIISNDLANDTECGARIAAAVGAFGCLRAFTHAHTSSFLPQTVRVHHVRMLLNHGGCNILPLMARHLSRQARETYVHA